MPQELAATENIEFTYYLGTIRDVAHDEELQEIARWLDQNKFSCTYSIVSGRALFDVCPHDDAKEYWAKRSLFSKDGFFTYASEFIIHCLSRALGERDGNG